MNIPTNPTDNKLSMTSRAQDVVAEQNDLVPSAEDSGAVKKKKVNTRLRKETDSCKSYRKKLISNWATSIDYRRGKPYPTQSDQDQVAVPLDWSMTKTKIASLYSQTPQVHVDHEPELEQPWLSPFEHKLNDTLVSAGIEAAMEECLADVINAAGIGAVLVSYESISEDKQVPSIDFSTLPPEIAAQAMQSGMVGGVQVPMETVPSVINHRYVVQRISPADFLWPITFTGSDFDRAPWIGRSGRIPWAEAVQKFKLNEDDKDKYLLGEDRGALDRLTFDIEKDKDQDDIVSFDELYYHLYQYDPSAKSYETIQHVVFVGSENNPVLDEPWEGQKLDEQDFSVTGARNYPIRALTLTYISDEPIPPSDSAIGRPMVNEINKSRGQIIMQRARNIPMRWIDINRGDPAIIQSLMKGTWQNIIPVQGDGTRIIGEVAKTDHPREDFTFDKVSKQDYAEAMTIGPNQMGQGDDVETRGEANQIASSYQTRIGRERAKVASFLVGIAEIIGSIMCLVEPEGFGQGFDPKFSQILSYSILADSTVLLDSNQRLKRINDFINMYAKSGWVNLEPVLKEAAMLSGLDPNTVIQPPQPKPPAEPNISFRFSGAPDISHPIALAIILGDGKAPTPELIEQAKQLIQQAVVTPPAPPPTVPPQGGAPVPGGDPNNPVPEPAPPTVGEANPQMTILPTVGKRSESGGIQ